MTDELDIIKTLAGIGDGQSGTTAIVAVPSIGGNAPDEMIPSGPLDQGAVANEVPVVLEPEMGMEPEIAMEPEMGMEPEIAMEPEMGMEIDMGMEPEMGQVNDPVMDELAQIKAMIAQMGGGDPEPEEHVHDENCGCQVEEELDTGYETTDVDASAYFPNGAESNVTSSAGPSSATSGDNPMQKSMKEGDDFNSELSRIQELAGLDTPSEPVMEYGLDSDTLNSMAGLDVDTAKAQAIELINDTGTSDKKKVYLTRQVEGARSTDDVIALLYNMLLAGEGLGSIKSNYNKRFESVDESTESDDDSDDTSEESEASDSDDDGVDSDCDKVDETLYNEILKRLTESYSEFKDKIDR